MNTTTGLKIKTKAGAEFEEYGKVTYMEVDNEVTYFCNGASFPAEIVTEVISRRSPDTDDTDRHKMYM